uniref:Beta-1,4-N-acetyl-galactosaminyl transferase 2 n=1 Tax=Xenopus tropicalis TaxID=8364 RepID=A0A803JZC9_XENTR
MFLKGKRTCSGFGPRIWLFVIFIVIVAGFAFLQHRKNGLIGLTAIHHPKRQLPPLYSDEELMSKFIYNDVNLYQNRQCFCPTEPQRIEVYHLKKNLNPNDADAMKARRKKEYEHYSKRQHSHDILIATPNSPLGYPAHGIQVKPLHTIQLPVKFTMDQHEAKIPVSIRQPPMIHLYDPGAEQKIESLVTITTKTFLRYDKLKTLISSIRQYYPDIKIIVADDNNVTEKIEDKNVEQYFMPFGKGWFAGRNLAVSQVTTKYFLWVDDDFLFTADTKIEKLVNVLESTNLDVVGGNVNGNHFSFRLLLQDGGEEGDCLHWRGGSYRGIEGFPKCVLTGGVVNFFLAHTDRVLSVGFDPKLQRVAHTEFFVDALGRLRVGSCSDVVVGHQKKDQSVSGAMAEQAKKYNSFRTDTKEQVKMKLTLYYFKNRLSCFTKH